MGLVFDLTKANMTPQEKLDLDLRDLWRICDGLAIFANLGFEEIKNRFKIHKEDALCDVVNYAGDGTQMCTRDAIDAIADLAERHRDSMAIPDDYSVEELAEAIRKCVVRAIVDEKQDEPALIRILSEAASKAEKRHVGRIYHFPCVIVPYKEPVHFNIGIVTFTSANAFRAAFAPGIQRYVEIDSDKTYRTQRVEDFQKYISGCGWLASVAVPPCAPESSKRRAEIAVMTAINLLRLLFGVDYGRDMRVVHLAYTQANHTEYAITENGDLDFYWSGKSSGALVEKDWYRTMDNHRSYWNHAAHLVSATVAGKRSEICDRVIDALTWFGEAAFESAPGIQIINFVAALERLTTTESYSDHKFCSRVAMLAYNEESDFEAAYWDAFSIHTARSVVVHGVYSPTSRASSMHVRLAHDLTRRALFRGLEVHCLLDDKGLVSSLAELQAFFDKQQSKWAHVLKKLAGELKARKEENRRKLRECVTPTH